MNKKIISNPSRASSRTSYREFGINDLIGRHCRFEDRVWIHNDGEGDSYFSCEIPLCRNGDRLEFQGLYITTYGDDYSKIIEMKLTSGPCMVFEFTWEDEEGDIQTGYADNFESAIW